jgi:hypothetical protein
MVAASEASRSVRWREMATSSDLLCGYSSVPGQ